MDDDQLTKLAVEELIKEGKKFVKRRELTYTFDEPTRKRPNLRYFKNTLNNCLSSNKRVEKVQKSGSAQRMQQLKKEPTSRTAGKKTHRTIKPYSMCCDEKIENKNDTSKKKKHPDIKRKLNDSEKKVSVCDKQCYPGTSKEDKRKKKHTPRSEI